MTVKEWQSDFDRGFFGRGRPECVVSPVGAGSRIVSRTWGRGNCKAWGCRLMLEKRARKSAGAVRVSYDFRMPKAPWTNRGQSNMLKLCPMKALTPTSLKAVS